MKRVPPGGLLVTDTDFMILCDTFDWHQSAEQEAMKQWLSFHTLDPHCVLYDSPIRRDPDSHTITGIQLVRENGHVVRDPNDPLSPLTRVFVEQNEAGPLLYPLEILEHKEHFDDAIKNFEKLGSRISGWCGSEHFRTLFGGEAELDLFRDS